MTTEAEITNALLVRAAVMSLQHHLSGTRRKSPNAAEWEIIVKVLKGGRFVLGGVSKREAERIKEGANE